jgi:MFS transporter, DHA1 family, inner membrane transport protein
MGMMLDHATAPVDSATSSWPRILLQGLGGRRGAAGRAGGGAGGAGRAGRGPGGPAFIVQVLALAGAWGVGVAARGELPAAGIAAMAWGAGTWMQTAPQRHRLLAFAPDAGRVVLSLNASAIYVGIGLGGLVGGLVLSGLPARTLPLVGAAVATAALLVLLRSRDPVRR